MSEVNQEVAATEQELTTAPAEVPAEVAILDETEGTTDAEVTEPATEQ